MLLYKTVRPLGENDPKQAKEFPKYLHHGGRGEPGGEIDEDNT